MLLWYITTHLLLFRLLLIRDLLVQHLLLHGRLLIPLCLLLDFPLLVLPHQLEVSRAPQLRCAEDAVQDRRDDLEHQCPSFPRRAPEVEDDGGLNNGACEGDDHGCEKDLGHEDVVVGTSAVQDDGDMGPELCDNVEGS